MTLDSERVGNYNVDLLKSVPLWQWDTTTKKETFFFLNPISPLKGTLKLPIVRLFSLPTGITYFMFFKATGVQVNL